MILRHNGFSTRSLSSDFKILLILKNFNTSVFDLCEFATQARKNRLIRQVFIDVCIATWTLLCRDDIGKSDHAPTGRLIHRYREDVLHSIEMSTSLFVYHIYHRVIVALSQKS